MIHQNDLISIPKSELINLGFFLNFSPGLCKKYYTNSFFSNYKKLISFFSKIIEYPSEYHVYEFESSLENNNDLDIKVIFINRIIKNFLIYTTSNKYLDNLLTDEIRLLESSINNKLYNNL